jgi:hypothetical protein
MFRHSWNIQKQDLVFALAWVAALAGRLVQEWAEESVQASALASVLELQ